MRAAAHVLRVLAETAVGDMAATTGRERCMWKFTRLGQWSDSLAGSKVGDRAGHVADVAIIRNDCITLQASLTGVARVQLGQILFVAVSRVNGALCQPWDGILGRAAMASL